MQIHVGVERTSGPRGKRHPALLVADIDALAARLAEAGAPVRWSDARSPARGASTPRTGTATAWKWLAGR
ncbi:hypothetical protein ACU686_17320 [Yinghuangia aomiensis]